MERIIRSCIQVGNVPEKDDAIHNWQRLLEQDLEFPNTEDSKIYAYLTTFYSQMGAPPDFSLLKEYFEKRDEIEAVSRLEEIKKAPHYTHTNFLSIIRSEREQQSIKGLVLTLRAAQQIAEHGMNLEKPVNGKKILRGAQDALNYMFEKGSSFSSVEQGEKLEGNVADDAEEVLAEYENVANNKTYEDRLIIGLEPVDSVVGGHKAGEFWVHTAFTSELKCSTKFTILYDHSTKKRRTVGEIFKSGDLPIITALADEGAESGGLKLIPAQTSHVVENGVQPTFKLSLWSGRNTTATANHPFFTSKGWKRLDELSPGDWVATPKRTTVPTPRTDFTDAEVKLVGYMIGDGSAVDSIRFSCLEPDIRCDFLDQARMISEDANFSVSEHFRKDDPQVRGVRIPSEFSQNHVDLLKRLSLWGVRGSDKFIPNEFFGLSDHQIGLLLSGLWSTDGTGVAMVVTDKAGRVSKRNDIRYNSKSERLCRDIQALLLRLGVQSSVRPHNFKYKGEPQQHWKVSISDARSKREFLSRVEVLGRGDWKAKMLAHLPPETDDTPYPTHLVPDGSKAKRKTTGTFVHAIQIKTRNSVSRDVLELFADLDPQIRTILDSDLVFDEVVSVESAGEQMTYDISVPRHKSLLVDDIVSHNTTLAVNYFYNNLYKFGKNLFYTILEMPYRQLRRQIFIVHSSHGKFVSEWNHEDRKNNVPEDKCYTGLNYQSVRDGVLTPLELKRFKIVAQDFQATCKGKAYIWRPGESDTTVEDIKRKSEMFHNKHSCDGIIIDHLGLVKPKNRVNDTVANLNSAVAEARQLALSFGRGKTVPVFGLFQLNRQGKMRADKADGAYDISAISYANEVEKSADVISYTYLNEELRRQGKFYMGCLKNRDGAFFEKMVGKIMWNSKRMRAITSPVGLLDRSASNIVNASKEISLTLADMMLPGWRKLHLPHHMTGTSFSLPVIVIFDGTQTE